MTAIGKLFTTLTLTLLAGSCTVPPSSFREPHEQAKLGYAQTIEAEFDALGHVGAARSLRWANLDTERVGLSCVDGRSDQGVLGTPGGDAGELLLLLAAAEAEGQRIDPANTPALIEAWIAEFGGFYMHTDVDALAELGRALAADPRFDGQLGGFVDARGDLDLVALEAWLRSPPVELHEPLLAHLLDPETVGCGHLRSVLRAPEDYDVRPTLAGSVIVGFYRRLWSSPDQPQERS